MRTSDELTGARERKDESFMIGGSFLSGQRLYYVSPGLFVNKSLLCV